MAATPAPPPSVLEDLVDVLWRPAAVFERRRETVAFGMAMVVLTMATALLYFAGRSALEPVFDAVVRQSLAEALRQHPELREEQLAAGRGVMRVAPVIGLLISPILVPLLSGLVLWGAARAVGARPGAAPAMMIAVYAWTPRVAGFLASIVVAVILPEDQIQTVFSHTLSAARLVDPATTPLALQAALARLDPFYLWSIAIMGIGLSVLGGVSRARGLAAAGLVWALGYVPQIPSLMAG